MLLPRWYNSAAVIAEDGMVPLHHNPGAMWTWRPCLYRRSIHKCWRQLGSQKELQWRYGLSNMSRAMSSSDDMQDQLQQLQAVFGMEIAEDKADKLLAEFLSDYQKVELALSGKFHVRGARTNNLYEIDLGDGFQLVDDVTHECVVSYCLHTEHWLPAADIALATKFALEDEELEMETLTNANMRVVGAVLEKTDALKRARDMERELL